MKNHLSLNKLKAVVALVTALFLLASCGFEANNSSEFTQQEKVPNILDKDYKPFDKKPIVKDVENPEPAEEDVIVTEPSGDDDIVIGSDDTDKPEDDVVVIGEEAVPNNSINHCLESDINSVNIINSTTENELEAFKIALYISGSFEGVEGWKNITNNFDGQGLSLGLFQQNLGQGSLQPLLINAIRSNPDILGRHFSNQQKQLLTQMLGLWAESEGLLVASGFKKIMRGLASVLNKFTSNKANTVRDSVSVNWALENLYVNGKKGKKIKPVWKKSFQGLANDPDYISLQQDAAMAIHNKALNYMSIYNTKTLVSYLFFFDIVVQNGSMRGLKYTSQLAGLSELKRLESLMLSRVDMARQKYKTVVLDRKSLILNSIGTVQNRDRDLSQETCIKNWSKITL